MMDASVVSEPTASPDETPASKGAAKSISLALQGGGAHGALTWGVLDRLIEDHRIGFDGIRSNERRRNKADRLMSTRRIR